ncbi:MAG: hypothetical protein GTN40_04225 [Candidatus Aenigmarchaeota archaeon]|nr:hypothetical protein [Candidatus Aenigmarchaeota archaeon]
MKKGLSPIVAVILILLIAISLTVLAMVWLPRFTFKLFPLPGFNESYVRSRGCLSIEDVKELFGFFTVKNCGKIALSDFKLFVGGKFVSNLDIEILEPLQSVNFIDMPLPAGEYEIYITADYAESPPFRLNIPLWECIGGEPTLTGDWYVSGDEEIHCICPYNTTISVEDNLYITENGSLSLYNCILELGNSNMYVRDNGFFNLTRSRMTSPGWGKANFEDNSTIYLLNSTLDGYPLPWFRDETDVTAINSFLEYPDIISSIPHRLPITDLYGYEYCPQSGSPLTKYIKADDSGFTLNFTNVSFDEIDLSIVDNSNTTIENSTFREMSIYSEYPHNLTIRNWGCTAWCERFDNYFKAEGSNFEFNGTNFYPGWVTFYLHGGSNNTIIDSCIPGIDIDSDHDSINKFINFSSGGGWYLYGRNFTMNFIDSRIYAYGTSIIDLGYYGSGWITWTAWNFSNTTISDRRLNFDFGNITFFGNVTFLGNARVGRFASFDNPTRANVTRYYPTIIKDSFNYPFSTIEPARINITDISNQSVWEGSVSGGFVGTYYIEDPKIKFNRTNYRSGNFNMKVSQVCENKTDIHLLNNTPFEFTLHRAFEYDEFSFNTPEIGVATRVGLAFDNSNFWVASSNNNVYQYSVGGTFVSSFDSGLNVLRDVASNGTYLWLLDAATETVRRYSTGGVPDGWSFSISQVVDPYAVDFDGEYFWVLGSSSVYKYDSSGSYTGFSSSLDRIETPLFYPDIVSFNGKIWILTDVDTSPEPRGKGVFRYKTDGTYDNWYFDIFPPTNTGRGLAHNGTYFWVINPTGTVYRYNLNDECLEIMEECDEFITFLPYTIDKNDTRYCLLYDLYIPYKTAITSINGVQNSSVDCLGYNLDGDETTNTMGIYFTWSETKNNTIKNCNITDFYYGTYLDNSDNNVLTNITFSSNRYGLLLEYSDSNILTNITASSNYYGIILEDYSDSNILTNITASSNDNYGFYLEYSDFNTLTNVTANFNDEGIRLYESSNILTDITANSNNYGIYLSSSFNNNITSGSILYNINYDYYLSSAGTTNKFTNTNFTDLRTIYFDDTTSWFNYNNETTENIWLKTKVSTITTITRELVNWDNAIMQWNDTPSSRASVRYNITGLLPYTYYYVYNNSVFTYTINSGSAGEISFTIDLPQNEEHEIIVNRSRQVLYLDFNEANGTKTYDKSGYGNNGTFYGETFNDGTINGATRVNGYFGKTLDFDGDNDYVRITDNPDLEGMDQLTIGLWFRLNQSVSSGLKYLTRKKVSSNPWYSYQLYITATNTVAFQITNESGESSGYIGSSVLDVDSWYHVTGTYDGSTVKIYLNGTLSDSISFTGKIFGAPTNDDLLISYDYTEESFNGTIDEVRIWNRALNETEIQKEMESSLPVIRPVASYSFEEDDSANYVNDTHIWVNGSYGSALSFDRIDDYVEVPDSETLKIATGELTIEAWVNPNYMPTGRATIVAKYGQPRWSLHYDGEDWEEEFGFYINDVRIVQKTYGTLSWGQWYHVAVTFSEADDTAILYVNGVPEDTDTSVTDSLPLDGNIYIARPFYTPSYMVNGTIDEVRIYDKVLTQQEIQDDMNNL